MHSGTVKFYDGKKGFGLIEPNHGGKDIFVHISALDRAGLGGLVEGQALTYNVQPDETGRNAAANLRLT